LRLKDQIKLRELRLEAKNAPKYVIDDRANIKVGKMLIIYSEAKKMFKEWKRAVAKL